MRTYGKATLDGECWRVHAEPHVLIRLKRVFPRLRHDVGGAVTFEATDETTRDLEWFMQRFPLQLTERDWTMLEYRSRRYDDHITSFSRVVNGKKKPRAFELSLPPREYQSVAAELAIQTRGLLVADDLGLGKQQPVDALVLTPGGWKQIGSICVGDRVIGSDGKPTAVTGVFPQGRMDVYAVHFSDGVSVEAGAEHLWTVLYRAGGRRWERFVASTEQLRTGATIDLEWGHIHKQRSRLNLGRKFSRFVPTLDAPVCFDTPDVLPVPPYTLGQILADGSTAHRNVRLAVWDRDWPHVRNRVLSEGVRFGRVAQYGAVVRATLPLLSEIRQLGVDVLSRDKFIPRQYLTASPEDRIALLHGLMDADGSCSPERSRVTYHSISSQLTADVQELVECLGGTGGIRRYDRSHQDKPTEYHVNVRLPPSIAPFTLPRKQVRYQPRVRLEPRRSFRKIEYSRNAASVCIQVEANDGLYVTEHGVLTHNTAVGIAMLTEPPTRPALVVTLTHLPNQWQREIQKFAPKLTTHIVKKGSPYRLELPDVLIMNYAKMKGWAETLAGVVKSVIFDEVQELRRAESLRYTAAKVIAENADYRLGLSATPIYNYGGEIYNVLDVIRPDSLGSHAEFLREWCHAGYTPGKERIRDSKAFGSYLRDEGLMLRRTRAEVGRELPPLEKVPHTVQADTQALEDAEDAASELARIILSQTSAWDERGRASRELDWRLRQSTGIAKAPYVAEFVRMLVESGEKVVLYGWHHAVYEVWKERLKAYKPALFTGAESASQKERARESFIDGDSRVLIMSLRAGAGLDGLQSQCKTIVFGELDWSYGVMEQCLGRVFRDGQTRGVTAYYLVADEGSDPVVADVLGVKKGQIEGMRDPSREPVTDAVDPDHVKRLARRFTKSTC